MKTTNDFENTIQPYLKERAKSDEVFAVLYAKND